jgi:hypothetical protein
MKDETDHLEWDNHLLKNDLNQYLESYIKYKDTMRKFVAPIKKKP